MGFYPAFLNLSGKKAVVVGGGPVAQRKVLSLLRAGARVRVVSPDLTVRLHAWAEAGDIAHSARPYRKGDLRGAFVVIAATDSAEVNSRVARDAPLLCNVVTSRELSNFTVAASVQRGDLVISVSTGGISPALARSIRLELGRLYGPEFGRYLAGLRKKRQGVLGSGVSAADRRKQLKALGGSGQLEAIRQGGLNLKKRRN